ncbi:hypothetical protein HHI36_020763 [Cryptolaemus montrouzieri]|uniref:Uncharacterized protein n=1 Tax=Cryptolaemus montrouzieri TaxID=559131 RepID=A0ABD2NCA6_9CUCU
MFTLPPWPPKDYVLKDVPKVHQSASEFTPIAIPRVTQPNLGKYLFPIQYTAEEKVEPQIKEVHPKIIEKWGEEARAWWVDKPGTNAYFLHQLHKESNLDSEVNNNPIFQHKEKVFNRPFSFELDCVEFVRLKKLQEKSDKERDEKCRYITKIEQAKLQREQEKESIKVVPCKWQPPFWWNHKTSIEDSENMVVREDSVEKEGSTYQSSYISWQEAPEFFRKSEDPCDRRKSFAMVGIPFRNDGCNWYYNRYPPPKIESTPQKFSK